MASSRKVRNSEMPALKDISVQAHLEAAYDSFSEFYKKLRINDVITSMLTNSTPFEIIESPSQALTKWRDSKSIPYSMAHVTAKKLAHLHKEKSIKTPKEIPRTKDLPNDLKTLNFLQSTLLSYSIGLRTNVFLEGLNIYPFINGLMTGKLKNIEPSKSKEAKGIALFCGGPISSLAICPRSDQLDNEILAVTTFADEVNFLLPDSPSTYIQLWSFPSDLKSEAECNILLEVPRCTVISLAWCPVLVDHRDKFFKSRSSRVQKASSDCSGLLAAATDKGVVFIYSIPRQLSDMRTKEGPVICGTSPIATLVCSKDYNASQCIPIGSLKWSFYDGGTKLMGVSDAGRILIWDLEKNPETFLDQSEELAHMRGITSVYPPVTSFSDPKWDSPPFDACWENKNKIVVSLRSRVLHIYSCPEMNLVLTESKPRSVGQILLQMPVLYDGFFTFDASSTSVDGICYSGSTHFHHRIGKTLQALPIFNRHQIQITDAAIGVRSGIISTVGLDGRFFQALNARVNIRGEDSHDRIFQYGRPLLHLVRLNRETEEDSQAPVSIKHEECCENSWLELRLGDAALLDMATTRKHEHFSPELLLDRRTEGLTRISASTLTEGLVAVGGEAGLIFLLPTLL